MVLATDGHRKREGERGGYLFASSSAGSKSATSIAKSVGNSKRQPPRPSVGILALHGVVHQSIEPHKAPQVNPRSIGAQAGSGPGSVPGLW